jgi:hypothetical protein
MRLQEEAVLVDDEPIGAALNRNLGSPTAPGEAVEAELNRLIERRSCQKDPDEKSELWRGSVRAYEQKRRQMACLEWHAFHSGQAARHRATLQALVKHHEGQAAKLMKDQPKGVG